MTGMTWEQWISQPGLVAALRGSQCMYQPYDSAWLTPVERCDKAAVRSLRFACVHEHIWTEHFCQDHHDEELAPGAVCEPCRWADGHHCPITATSLELTSTTGGTQ